MWNIHARLYIYIYIYTYHTYDTVPKLGGFRNAERGWSPPVKISDIRSKKYVMFNSIQAGSALPPRPPKSANQVFPRPVAPEQKYMC